MASQCLVQPPGWFARSRVENRLNYEQQTVVTRPWGVPVRPTTKNERFQKQMLTAMQQPQVVVQAPTIADATAQAPAMTASPNREATCELFLTAPGHKKISVIKLVRDATHLGLKEAKALVDNAPSVVMAGITVTYAEELKRDFENAGATVEVRKPELCDLVLTALGDNSAEVFKVIQRANSLTPLEIQGRVGGPMPLKSGMHRVEAEHLKRDLENAGAAVELRLCPGQSREPTASEDTETAPPPPSSTEGTSLSSELERVMALHERGALSDEEFAAAKRKLLRD